MLILTSAFCYDVIVVTLFKKVEGWPSLCLHDVLSGGAIKIK